MNVPSCVVVLAVRTTTKTNLKRQGKEKHQDTLILTPLL